MATNAPHRMILHHSFSVKGPDGRNIKYVGGTMDYIISSDPNEAKKSAIRLTQGYFSGLYKSIMKDYDFSKTWALILSNGTTALIPILLTSGGRDILSQTKSKSRLCHNYYNKKNYSQRGYVKKIIRIAVKKASKVTRRVATGSVTTRLQVGKFFFKN